MQSSSKKIRVFLIGQDNVNWSIDSDRKNTAQLFINSVAFEVTSNIFKADIIYSVWYNILERPWYFYPILFLKKIKNVKVFAVITNRIENTPEKISHLEKLIDVWVSPSAKTHMFIKGKHLTSIHIPFLVDKKIFYKLPDTKIELAKKLNVAYSKISNKTLIGSFQRDSLGSDLSKPKWQKNPALLVKILKKLPPEKYVLVLAGPRRHYLINECKKNNIPYIFIGNEDAIKQNRDDALENNLSLDKINLLYNLIDIYIVSSKSEGGPKAILEAALTETLIFSTPVGLAEDILHHDLIYSADNLQNLIKIITKRLTEEFIFTNEIHHNKKQVNEGLNETTILKKIQHLIN
jgi:hypothetical protein